MPARRMRQALVNLDAGDARPAACRWCSARLAGILLHEAIGTVWKAISIARARRRLPAWWGNSGSARRHGGGRRHARRPARFAQRGRRGHAHAKDRAHRRRHSEGYLQDTLNARLMNVAPTGNGRRESYAHMRYRAMTNTYMLPGIRDPQEIIARSRRACMPSTSRRPGGHHQCKFVFSASEAYLIENRQGDASGEGRHPDRNGRTCSRA